MKGTKAVEKHNEMAFSRGQTIKKSLLIAAMSVCLFGMADNAMPQTNNASKADADIKAAMCTKVKERIQKDKELYGVDGLREIEIAYRAYSKSKDADNEHLQTLITKFPKANRTGCAVMYAGQRSRGTDDGKWFRLAVENYGDCFYGDGAQVGAYARFYLAGLLERKGDKAGAEKLRCEILELYPDALTHRGRKMANYLRKAK